MKCIKEIVEEMKSDDKENAKETVKKCIVLLTQTVLTFLLAALITFAFVIW